MSLQVLECDYVLTCAGLYSDRVASMTGCLSEPKIVPFRGEYLLLSPEKSKLIRGNIYPVPDPAFPFLGVHFTPRLNGEVKYLFFSFLRDATDEALSLCFSCQTLICLSHHYQRSIIMTSRTNIVFQVWLGPNAVLAFKREGYNWSDIGLRDLSEILTYPGFYRLAAKYVKFGSLEMLRSAFISLSVKELQKFVPDVTVQDIQRGPAGVRAQAMNVRGDLVGDFIFDSPETGILSQRVLHCRNAPSPGATSSIAIARMMADKMEETFGLPKRANAQLY